MHLKGERELFRVRVTFRHGAVSDFIALSSPDIGLPFFNLWRFRISVLKLIS